MAIDVDGKYIEASVEGYLANVDDWSEQVAEVLAAADNLSLGERHWDIIRYLRDEYFDNHASQPNNRTMLKELGRQWGEKLDSKYLYELFPGNPSKQAGRIAGLPESRRKGGY